MLRSKTPLEEYKIGKRTIYVKRDDLIGDGKSTPPWGKILGVGKVVKSLDYNRPLVHLNVWGSWSAWAISYYADQHNIEFHMAYPNQKNFPSEYVEIVESYGGKLKPLKPNMFNVLYAQTKRFRDENNFQMMPNAFDSPIYHKYIMSRLESAMIDSNRKYHNLIVSSGSGVTISALAKRFFELGGKNIFTICVSSERTVRKEVVKKLGSDQSITIIKSEFNFNNMMPQYSTPFPCNEMWDKKAWHWLEHNISSIPKGNTLFWNLGGHYGF